MAPATEPADPVGSETTLERIVTATTSFIGLCLLLLAGHVLRSRIRLLQKLYLPSCVIGGLLGLAVIQVIGALGAASNSDHWLGQCFLAVDAAVPNWTAGWSKLPGILVNVVFACLFLGVALPKVGVLFRRAGPQLAYGQVVAWGQYVVGIGLFVLLIRYIDPELPAMFGAIIPVGFEGGHGTAGGMEPTFARLNWEAGKDFALASATAGVISAVVVGMVLIN